MTLIRGSLNEYLDFLCVVEASMPGHLFRDVCSGTRDGQRKNSAAGHAHQTHDLFWLVIEFMFLRLESDSVDQNIL